MFNIHQPTHYNCALALKQESMPKVESLQDPHPTQAMDAAGILDRHRYDVIKYR